MDAKISAYRAEVLDLIEIDLRATTDPVETIEFKYMHAHKTYPHDEEFFREYIALRNHRKKVWRASILLAKGLYLLKTMQSQQKGKFARTVAKKHYRRLRMS